MHHCVLDFYKIFLKLGGKASQHDDYIQTWYEHGGCMYVNHFIIDRETGQIKHDRPEEMYSLAVAGAIYCSSKSTADNEGIWIQ